MDRIRYAWGDSSLGPFLAAVSETGLVAFEFAEPRAGIPESLRQRLAGSELVEDTGGPADTVGRLAAVIDDPAGDSGIALDPRGFEAQLHIGDG